MVTKETEGSGWSVYTFVSRFMGKPLRPFHESVEDFKAITVNESFMPHIGTLSGKYWGRNLSVKLKFTLLHGQTLWIQHHPLTESVFSRMFL